MGIETLGASVGPNEGIAASPSLVMESVFYCRLVTAMRFLLLLLFLFFVWCCPPLWFLVLSSSMFSIVETVTTSPPIVWKGRVSRLVAILDTDVPWNGFS